MGYEKKFSEGVKFLSSIYDGKLNGHPFDRKLVKSIVTILKKMGFRHVGNKGTLAILVTSKGGSTQIIYIGKKDGKSFFRLETSEQQVLSI